MTNTTHDARPFGALLAELRSRRGWSQYELAADAGYDRSYICRLEAGMRGPSRETVGVLAANLNLDTVDSHRLFVAAGLLPPGVWLAGATMLTLLDGDA